MGLIMLVTAVQSDGLAWALLGCALLAMTFIMGLCAVLWPRSFLNRRRWGDWLPFIYLKGLMLMGGAVFFSYKFLQSFLAEWFK